MREESARVRDIWNEAYAAEVDSLDPGDPVRETHHNNAMRLLDEVRVDAFAASRAITVVIIEGVHEEPAGKQLRA